MEDITTNTHTVVKDSRGRTLLMVADNLSAINISEPVPEGTPGWDKQDLYLSRYNAGEWRKPFQFAASLEVGSFAVYTVNFDGNNPTNGQTITIPNGDGTVLTYTFVTSAAAPYEVTIGMDSAATVIALADEMDGHGLSPIMTFLDASVSSELLILTSLVVGTAGNGFQSQIVSNTTGVIEDEDYTAGVNPAFARQGEMVLTSTNLYIAIADNITGGVDAWKSIELGAVDR